MVMTAGFMGMVQFLLPGILDGIVATKYVSPTGGTGAGTLGDPWSLAHAITSVTAGDVVQLRGGDYRTTGSSYTFTIGGTLSAGEDSPGGKIIWMPYPGEQYRLVNANIGKAIEPVRIQATYNWFVDMETFREHEDRYTYSAPGNGIWLQDASTTGVKLLHTRVHDGGAGLYISGGCGNAEIYGHMGWYAGVCAEPRVHGAYVHHDAGLLKMHESIFFSTLGLGIQGYTSGGADGGLSNIDAKGLIVFEAGQLGKSGTGAGGPPQTSVLFGSDQSGFPLTDSTFSELIVYNKTGDGSAAFRFYNSAGGVNQIVNATLQDSYLVGGAATAAGAFRAMKTASGSTPIVRRNTFIQQNAVALLTTEDTVAGNYTTWVWEDNEHWGQTAGSTRWNGGGTNRTFAGWKTFTGLGSASGHADVQHDGVPTVNKVFVRAVNKYFQGRAHVVFFNWESLGRVAVNLTGILLPGDTFVVKNVQDVLGSDISVYDVVSGGSPITTLPSDGVVYFPTDGVTPPLPWGSNQEPVSGSVSTNREASLPSLPNGTYPPGSWCYPADQNKAYKNVGDVWVNTTEWTNPPENMAPFFGVFYVRKP